MVIIPSDVSDPLVVPTDEARWRVLRTRSRREKQVAAVCVRSGVGHYLPLREARPASRRRIGTLVPLFSGYVFACPTPEEYVELLQTGLIAKVLPVPRPEALVEELRQIRVALAVQADLVPGAEFRRGRPVRVVTGKLQGVIGVVTCHRVRRGRVQLVLNITLLGVGARVEIDAADVVPIGGWRDRAVPIAETRHRLDAVI